MHNSPNSDEDALTNPWCRLQKLTEIIKHESRFVTQEPYKSFVDSVVRKVHEKSQNSIVSSGTTLYRARINKINFEKKEHDKIPFSSSEMGPPPQLLAISGRINPEGISYLYCAGELDTAGAELRPWKGAYLTIAEIEIQNDIMIADLTSAYDDDSVHWKLFFYDFADLFSIQWPPELKLNYLVTQFFSEHFKAAGFHGIKYRSEFNVGGNNYALFHKNDYEIVKTYTVETSDISYFFYEHKTTDENQGAV